MSKSQENRFTFKLFIILLITTFCLGISFYQMTRGYAEFGGYIISGMISLVIVAILFFLSIEIHRAKKRGESYIQYLAVYLFFALLSFAGNYNGFYGRALSEEMVNTELDQKFQKLDELYSNTEVAFKEKYGITPQVDALVSDLNKQIINDANGGCGKRCMDILQKISNILNRDITNQGFKDTDRTKLFDNYRRTIYGEEEVNFLKDFSNEIDGLKKEREKITSPLLNKEDASKSQSAQKDSDKEVESKKLTLLGQLVGLYKQRGLNAQAKISNTKQLFDTQLKVENTDVGKLKHTFDTVISNLNRPVIWGLAFVALMIDLFVPLFIILITKNEGEKKKFVRQRDIEIL